MFASGLFYDNRDGLSRCFGREEARQGAGAKRKSRAKGPAFQKTQLVGHEGQQRDLTSTLDGLGELTLMHGAGAGGAAGQDLAPLRQVPAQLGLIRIGIVCAAG